MFRLIDVGDLVAHGFGPQVVGDAAESVERGALRPEQRERVPVGERAMGGRLRECDLDLARRVAPARWGSPSNLA